MKLATFVAGDRPRVGLVDAEAGSILDLSAAGSEHPFLGSMVSLIERGDEALEVIRDLARSGQEHRLALSKVRLLAPLPRPEQIRDFFIFPGHIRQSAVGMRKLAARLEGTPVGDTAPGEVPEIFKTRPVYYISNRNNVSGPGDDISWPRYSEIMDFELEFAAVIGKAGKDITQANARDHIFGYTLFNDFSARDAQFLEMKGGLGPAKGKSFDGANSLGPWIVTADEIADPYDLTLEARVNGEVWASSTTSDSLFTFEDLIAYVSRDETIYPGEIFGSGTLKDGCGLEHDRYLQDGDVVELQSSVLGTLRNTVRSQT